MKKLFAIVVAVTLLAVASGTVLAANSETGNNAPSGYHYNLNIIGMQNNGGKSCEVGGHVIFVGLKNDATFARTRIDLKSGPDFEVLDCNGLDGKAAFQLPTDVSADWEVWVRALGKPGGTADMRTCGENVTDDIVLVKVCGADLHLEAHGNNNKFINASGKLLFVNGIPLFDPTYQNYFWEYDNNGLKLAQLRFYPKAQ